MKQGLTLGLVMVGLAVVLLPWTVASAGDKSDFALFGAVAASESRRI